MAEFDLEQAEWRIPAAKIKMRRLNRVPLSMRSLAIIRELQAISGDGRWLFPSVRSTSRPMSKNTLNAALRRLGYSKEQMTAHGFKGMASSRSNEMGHWSPDAIERQLAHQESDDLRADLDQLLFQARQRPVLDRLRLRQGVCASNCRDGACLGGAVVRPRGLIFLTSFRLSLL
jgi:integrase